MRVFRMVGGCGYASNLTGSTGARKAKEAAWRAEEAGHHPVVADTERPHPAVNIGNKVLRPDFKPADKDEIQRAQRQGEVYFVLLS